MVKTFDFSMGDILSIDFGNTVDYRLAGKHPGLIWKRFGSTVLVIPITENKNNLNWSEIAITKGEANLRKNSKIKAGQIQPISIDKIHYNNKIGTISKKKLIEIRMSLKHILL